MKILLSFSYEIICRLPSLFPYFCLFLGCCSVVDLRGASWLVSLHKFCDSCNKPRNVPIEDISGLPSRYLQPTLHGFSGSATDVDGFLCVFFMLSLFFALFVGGFFVCFLGVAIFIYFILFFLGRGGRLEVNSCFVFVLEDWGWTGVRS